MAGSSGALATGVKSDAARASTSAKPSAPSAAPSTDSTSARSGRPDRMAASLASPDALVMSALAPAFSRRQRSAAEHRRERQRDRAELVDRDVDRGDFGRLRQQDGDAVAARDAVGAQRMGEPVRGLAQPAIGQVITAPVRPDMDEGELVRRDRRPAVAYLDPDIVGRRQLPAELPVERVVVAGFAQHGATGGHTAEPTDWPTEGPARVPMLNFPLLIVRERKRKGRPDKRSAGK